VDYQTLDRWTDAAAHAHAAAGLRPGERIGIIGDNSLEWVVTAIGALKLARSWCRLNYRFTPDELRYLVDDAGPVMVFADEAHRTGWPPRWTAPRRRDGPTAAVRVYRPAQGAARASGPAGGGPDDITQIVYTSGTSSRPKGVLFTHRSTFNLIAGLRLRRAGAAAGGADDLRPVHSGAPGLLWHILHPLTRGLSIFYERGLRARRTLRRLEEEKIQIWRACRSCSSRWPSSPGSPPPTCRPWSW